MKAQIAAIEYVLPDRCLTNKELDRLHPEWAIDKVAKRTGVTQRHICRDDETALDLATAACERLFEKEVVTRDEIGGIIVCTQSPDYIMPPNSTLLQHRLRLPLSVAAFDFSLACSGFIYGLFMAKALIESQLLDNIILVTAEAYSKYVNPNDRGAVSLFGDAAAATLIRRGSVGLGEFILGTDGSGGGRFIIPAGGARTPRSPETCIETTDTSGNVRSQENIFMDGPAVLSFIKAQVPKCVNRLLSENGYTYDDISLFLFHQSSALSLDYLETMLKIPKDKMWRSMDLVGNTVSASVPIALRDAQLEGRISPGDRLLLAGFGVGFSWGACVVEW